VHNTFSQTILFFYENKVQNLVYLMSQRILVLIHSFLYSSLFRNSA